MICKRAKIEGERSPESTKMTIVRTSCSYAALQLSIVHIADIVATSASVHDEDSRSGPRSSPYSNFVLFLQVKSRALEQAPDSVIRALV